MNSKPLCLNHLDGVKLPAKASTHSLQKWFKHSLVHSSCNHQALGITATKLLTHEQAAVLTIVGTYLSHASHSLCTPFKETLSGLSMAGKVKSDRDYIPKASFKSCMVAGAAVESGKMHLNASGNISRRWSKQLFSRLFRVCNHNNYIACTNLTELLKLSSPIDLYAYRLVILVPNHKTTCARQTKY